MGMKVSIETDVCQGHGQCVMACPEVFDFDEQGFSVLKTEDVPAEHEDAVARAERSCPERAIKTTR